MMGHDVQCAGHDRGITRHCTRDLNSSSSSSSRSNSSTSSSTYRSSSSLPQQTHLLARTAQLSRATHNNHTNLHHNQNPQKSEATQAHARTTRASAAGGARARTSEDIAINLRRWRQAAAVACDALAQGGDHGRAAANRTLVHANTTQGVCVQGVHLKPCRVRSRHSSGENVWMPTARPARASCGAIWRAKNERENNPKHDCKNETENKPKHECAIAVAW